MTDSGSGKSALLARVLAHLDATCDRDEVRVFVVDPRRGLRAAAGASHLVDGYVPTAAAADDLARSLFQEMRGRLDAVPADLDAWATNTSLHHPAGPWCVVLVDDADLLSSAPGSPWNDVAGLLAPTPPEQQPVPRGWRGPWTVADEMVLRNLASKEIAAVPAVVARRGLKPGDEEYQLAFNNAQGLAAERALRAMDPKNYAETRRTPVTIPGEDKPYNREQDTLRVDRSDDGDAFRGAECKTGLVSYSGDARRQLEADIEWLRLKAAENVEATKEWHFFPNARGEVGSDSAFAARAREGGIRLVVHAGPDWQLNVAQGGGAAAGAAGGADTGADAGADEQPPVGAGGGR